MDTCDHTINLQCSDDLMLQGSARCCDLVTSNILNVLDCMHIHVQYATGVGPLSRSSYEQHPRKCYIACIYTSNEVFFLFLFLTLFASQELFMPSVFRHYVRQLRLERMNTCAHGRTYAKVACNQKREITQRVDSLIFAIRSEMRSKGILAAVSRDLAGCARLRWLT